MFFLWSLLVFQSFLVSIGLLARFFRDWQLFFVLDGGRPEYMRLSLLQSSAGALTVALAADFTSILAC